MAKIHIAKKQLALPDDTYRAVLKRVTGRDSSADMNIDQLEAVHNEFVRLGFKAKATSPTGSRKQATSPQAKKIRALWLVLRDASELKDASEDALVAFVSKTTGINDMQWLTSAHGDKVIKALRGWIERVGA